MLCAAPGEQQHRDSEFDQPEMEIGPMTKRYTEEQIIGFLREADAGMPIKELCRKHGFSEASFYGWKAKFGGMNVSDARRLKALEAENGKLKRLLVNSMLEVDVMREVLKGKWWPWRHDARSCGSCRGRA
jgi:putative transposase